MLVQLLILTLSVGAAQAQSAAPPEGLQLSQGGWKLTARASLGGQWLVWVGDEASFQKHDPVVSETVRLAQSAVDLKLQGPASVFASLRAEEGLMQGDTGAMEAWVGVALLQGKGGVWVGQNDLPVTRDRGRENDGLALSWRPVLSEQAFVLHPVGAGVGLAWPGRLSLRTGAAYDPDGPDRPMVWGRFDLHPMGSPPDRQDRRVDGVRFLAGAGLVAHNSEIIGSTDMVTGDLELRFGPAEVSGAWVRLRRARTDGTATQWAEWIATVGSALFGVRNSDVHLQVRGERVTGLFDDEAARWIPTGRLSLRSGGGALHTYVEGRLSLEQPADDASADVVKRGNNVVGVGMLARW